MTRRHEQLRKIVLDRGIEPAERARRVAAYLDPLPLSEKIVSREALGGRRVQSRLWQAAGCNPPVLTSDLVPPDHTALRPVVFHGRNSLPVFSYFQKICCRPSAGAQDSVLWGYNETPMRPLIGPGYYVVHDTPGSALGASAFDYTEVPVVRAPGWPDIRGNEVGLSRFVYNHTVDYMRRVATGVFIGSATRDDRELGNYFIIVRQL